MHWKFFKTMGKHSVLTDNFYVLEVRVYQEYHCPNEIIEEQ